MEGKQAIKTFQVLIIAAGLGFSILSSQVFACQFDVDCSPGSKCLKKRSQLYGVCIGGIKPGNKWDKKPVYDPLDTNRTTGNTCSFNVDCGPGSKCVKSHGIYGVCLRKR